MKKHIFLGLLVVALQACKQSEKTTTKTTDQIIETIGDKPVYASEFAYVYKKNNANSDSAYTPKNINEYLNLYTNFRLKVREAEVLGLDTAESFKKELGGYKKQLAQPYLTEKSVTEQLAKEAYERMKEEVNASHILITVGPDADPKDSLEAYNKIVEIRNKAIQGESFEKLAQEFSQDPSAKTNKGSLGYFSALQMVYPFENAAYNTPKGQISQPLRTRFGYHILKVNDRRKSQGQVKVAHIMIRATQGISEADSIAAKQKIDEIYSRLQKGEDWKQLTEQFSEDANSKSKGGELPWFSTGRMIPSFEEAAFALPKIGDYTQPVQTPYGWHIIKLLERKDLEPYAELESSIKTKVSKDSRSDLNKTVLLQRLKKENSFVEYPKALDAAVSIADSTVLLGAWTKKAEGAKNLPLFTIAGKNYMTQDFYNWLSSTNRKTRERKGVSPAQYMRNLYRTYADETLIGYEESHLEDKYVDYKMLVKEYRDGILLFQLMDEKVWSKAINDSTGLKEYFAKNGDKFKWGQRAHAAVYSVPNEEVLGKLKEALKADQFPVKSLILENSFFDVSKTDLTDRGKVAADEAAAKLKRDKNYLMEITGYSDGKESTGKNVHLSKKRAWAVRDYIVSKGGDSTRILVKDGGKEKTKAGEKDRALDRKVTYTMYSKSAKALESSFNESAPLTLQVTEGVFQKGDNEIVDMAKWNEGSQVIHKNDRVYLVNISKIEAPRQKTFEEARGLTISEYQNYLEQEWIKSLKEKYPVTVKTTEVDKIIKR